MSRTTRRTLRVPLQLLTAGAMLCSLGAGCRREVEVFDRDPSTAFGDVGSSPPSGFFDGGAGPMDDAIFRLGQALFFDKELSGNRDISCATCHVPFLQTVETLPLSIGQGGVGVGPTRALADGSILPRNTSDLFGRGTDHASALFWDGRVERLANGAIRAPVPLPQEIATLLEAQALLPLLDRDEMRGHLGDASRDGRANELAAIDDSAPEAVWQGIVNRLLSIGEYRRMFDAAFPNLDPRDTTIVHVARALAHFQSTQWDPQDSAFDDNQGAEPLPEDVAAGRGLFFGEAGCHRCHSGPLLSDQAYHNIGVPQLGPGKDPETGLDEGRFLVTGEPEDRFAFRTPPLRNVRLTGPWMHNGAFETLEAAVRHHLDPEASLRDYTGEHLSPLLRETLQTDPEALEDLLSTLNPQVRPSRSLSDVEVAQLLAFLGTLDSSVELNKSSGDGVPGRVPSDLPVDQWPGGPHPFR